MGFAEQLLLNGLGDVSVYLLLIIAILYLFYMQVRSTITYIREENKELKNSRDSQVASLVLNISELKGEINILTNNLNNFLQSVSGVETEVSQLSQNFITESSRILNEAIRSQEHLKKLCESIQLKGGSLPDDI